MQWRVAQPGEDPQTSKTNVTKITTCQENILQLRHFLSLVVTGGGKSWKLLTGVIKFGRETLNIILERLPGCGKSPVSSLDSCSCT